MHSSLLCMQELELLDQIEACDENITRCKRALSDLERNKCFKKNINQKSVASLKDKINQEIDVYSAEKEKLIDKLAK